MFYLQVLSSCHLLPSSSSLMSLLGEHQPDSQLEEAKGLLLAVGGEEGLLALIDVANKKMVSTRYPHTLIRRSDGLLHQVYQTKLESPVLAVSPLNAALLVGCEDGSLHKIVLKDEVMAIFLWSFIDQEASERAYRV